MKYFIKELRKDWAVPPNLLTEVRGIFSPLPAILLMIGPEYRMPAMVVFVVLAVTDKLDGYLARTFDMQTPLGKMMDPVVDKLLVIFTLVALSVRTPVFWWPAGLIFVRESIIALWTVRAEKRGIKVMVVQSGRVKMTVQSVAIAMMFLPMDSELLAAMVWSVIVLAMILTVTSGIEYVSANTKPE